jgi:hypothetical protein
MPLRLHGFADFANYQLPEIGSWHCIFRPWVYLMIGMVVILAYLKSHTPQRMQIALIAASGFAHEAGLFVGVLMAGFRYSHYMIYTSLLAFLLFLQTVLPYRARPGFEQVSAPTIAP